MQYKVDTRRLLCPMPVIRMSQMINKINVGDIIELLATDPGTLHDIPAWCRVHGHKIINIEEKNTKIVILVKKI